MFRAGVKAGFLGAVVIALVQLLSFLFSLLPRSLGLSFGGCFFVITLLVLLGAGAWAGQLVDQPTVRRSLGAGGLAGLIAGLAQGLMLALTMALGITVLHLTGQLTTTLSPASVQALGGPGSDLYTTTLTFMTTMICALGGPIFLALGSLLGAGGGAAYVIIARPAARPALVTDEFDEDDL